jgi:hypothetical protein
MKQIATANFPVASGVSDANKTCVVEEKHEDDSDSENDIDYKHSLK